MGMGKPPGMQPVAMQPANFQPVITPQSSTDITKLKQNWETTEKNKQMALNKAMQRMKEKNQEQGASSPPSFIPMKKLEQTNVDNVFNQTQLVKKNIKLSINPKISEASNLFDATDMYGKNDPQMTNMYANMVGNNESRNMMDPRSRIEMEAVGNRAKLKEQLRKQMIEKEKQDELQRIKAEMEKEIRREFEADMEKERKKLLLEDPKLKAEMQKLEMITEVKRKQEEQKSKEEKEN